MVTHLPHGLQKLLEFTVGMPWPEGDEDDLWTLSAEWDAVAHALDELAADLVTSANNFSQVLRGTTGDSIRRSIAIDLHAGAMQLKDQAAVFSDMTKNAAADIQKTKIMIVGMLAILAATLAALFASIFGAFAAPAVISAARVGIGALLRGLMTRLFQLGVVNLGKHLAISTLAGAAFGTAFMVTMDSAIQGVQLAQGRRKGFDVASLKGGAIGGAIGGAFGGFLSGFGTAAASAGRNLWRAMPRGVRAFAPLGHTVLQIPGAAISNPVTNKATNSRGGAMDGIFGGLEPGRGGRARTKVPKVSAAAVQPLEGLSFPTPVKPESDLQLATAPVIGSDGRVVGVSHGENSGTGGSQQGAENDNRHLRPGARGVSESRLGGEGWGGGPGRATDQRDAPAGTPDRSADRGLDSPSGRQAGTTRPAEGRGRGRGPEEGGTDRNARTRAVFDERGETKTGPEASGTKAFDGVPDESVHWPAAGTGRAGEPMMVPGTDTTAPVITHEQGVPVRVAEPGEPSWVMDRQLSAEGDLAPADGGSRGVVVPATPETHSGGSSSSGRVTEPARTRDPRTSTAPTDDSSRSTTFPEIRLGTPAAPGRVTDSAHPGIGRTRERATNTPGTPAERTATTTDGGSAAAPGTPESRLGVPTAPGRATEPVRLGTDTTASPADNQPDTRTREQATSTPRPSTEQAPDGHRDPAVRGDEQRLRTESVPGDSTTGRPLTDPERGELTSPATAEASRAEATTRPGARGGEEPVQPGHAARPTTTAEPVAGAADIGGPSTVFTQPAPEKPVSSGGVPGPDAGSRTRAGVPELAGREPTERIPVRTGGSEPSTSGRLHSDTAGPSADDRRGTGAREQATTSRPPTEQQVPPTRDPAPRSGDARVRTEFVRDESGTSRGDTGNVRGESGVSQRDTGTGSSGTGVGRAESGTNRGNTTTSLGDTGTSQATGQGPAVDTASPSTAPHPSSTELRTGKLSRFAAVVPDSPGGPADRPGRTAERLEPLPEGNEPATHTRRFSGIDESGREVDLRASELQVHRLRDKNGEPVGITFVTGHELNEVLSVTRTAYDGTTRLAPNTIVSGWDGAKTTAAPWPENSFYVHTHGFTGSFVVTTADGRPLRVSGETFGHLLHDLRPFRDSMDRLKPEAIGLIVCLVGAVDERGGAGHDFQHVLGQLGYEQPVVAATKVMGQRWDSDKGTWGTHITDGGFWRTLSSGPARVLGEDRSLQVTSFDPGAVRATPLITDGRVTGVSYRQGATLDRAVHWAAEGAQVGREVPFPRRTFFVDAESTSDGRMVVHTEDGRRLAVEGGAFGRVVANTRVFREADDPSAVALLASDAAKSPDVPAAASHSVEFARALEQEFEFQRPVFAPEGRIRVAEGPDGRSALRAEGVRWQTHLAPGSLRGLDDAGVPQLFRAADVRMALVRDGDRPRALSFHDTGSAEHAALQQWIDGGGTARRRGVPWSDDAFFIASPAGPSGFDLRLGNGRSVRVDGQTFARVVAESLPFREAMEAANGQGATAFPLLASATGRLTRPGGAARDFQRALAERFGYGQPVYAPTGRVELGTDGRTAVSGNGEWRSYPEGPLPVSGRDLTGRQAWFCQDDVQVTPLREGHRVIGISFGPDVERVQEWASRPGKEVTHVLPWRQYNIDAALRSNAETARPAPWPDHTFYVEAAGLGRRLAVEVGQQKYSVDGENLAALVAQSEPFRQAVAQGRVDAVTLLASTTGAAGGPAAGFQRALAERFGQDKPVYAPTNFLRLLTSEDHGSTTVVANGGEWATFLPEPVRPTWEPAPRDPLASIPEESFPEISLRSPVSGFDAQLRDLNVRVLDDRSFELLGSREALRRYSVTPAEHSPGGFTLSDAVTRNRFHFSEDGTLVGAKVRLENDLGVLHQDFSNPGSAPTLQRPLNRFPLEVSPDGRVTLTTTSPDERGLERLIVDPATGAIVEKTAFGRQIPFKSGSSRLSNDELRAIDELAARTVREGLAAFDGGRPLPEVRIEGHGNGTVLGRPAESRAVRQGLDRAEAVRKAFDHSLNRHLNTASAERAMTPAATDFPVEVTSRGRKYPEGFHPGDGPNARRQAVITVTPRPLPEDVVAAHGPDALARTETDPPHASDAPARTEAEPTPHEDRANEPTTEVREPEPVAAQRGLTLQQLMESETLAETSHAELPWYVGRDGMDAMGEVAIREVDPWDEHLVGSWADEIAGGVRRPGDSPAFEADLRAALRKLLQGAPVDRAVRTLEAERNRELDHWETVLQRGQLTTADGQVLWLRPVLRDMRPLPPREASDIQQYNVNWGTLTTAEKAEWEKSRSAESIFLATTSTGMKAVSSLTSGPFMQVSAHRSGSTHQHRYVIFDRKVWMLQGTPFRGGLHVRVFLNGVERHHDVVTPARVTVDLPKALTAPGGLRHVPHSDPLGDPGEPVAGPHRAREVINAIDLIPVAAEFQRRLHSAGLPEHGVRELMDRTLGLLNERAVMNRSRYFLGNEVATDKVTFSTGLGSSFKGHVTFRAVIEGLEYLGDSAKVGVREDLGGATKVQRKWDGKSAFSVGGRVLAAPMEFASVKTGLDRKAGHSHTEETGIHTVLQTTEDHSRYRAWLRVTVQQHSTTHHVEPVTRIVQTEIAVPRPEAADFERRLLGPDADRLRQPRTESEGAVTAPPYVRSALADSTEPGLGLPESAHRRPERLDAPLPAPHPREPLALATRRGVGFGTAIGLPGAELVHDQLRTVLLEKHQEWTGQRRVDLSGVDRALLGGFGRAALEGDLPSLLSGVEHTVRLGGETYQLSVSARLLERVGGAVGDDARTMSINLRASQVAAVGGHRDNSWSVNGFLGVRARLDLAPVINLQLGQAGLSGGFGRSTKQEFSGSAKTSQRVDMVGKVDEHVLNVVYELAVRSGDRVQRWWIDRPGEVVARIVVPHLHVPREPITADALAYAGRITPRQALPAAGTVDFLSNGTGAVFRSFLAVPGVERTAADLYAQANKLPQEWLQDRGNWPAALKKIFAPTELAAHFPALAGRTGRRVELPAGADGWHQVLQVRVVAAHPRHVTAHGDKAPFQIWQNTSATAKYRRSEESSHSHGGQVNVGVVMDFGPTGDKGVDGEGRHSVHGRLTAVGGGSVTRKFAADHGAATYPMGITRGTYTGPMHTYQADPVFEISLLRWPNRGVVDRVLGRSQDMTTATRVLEVKDGLEFVVPERRIFDLGLPVPDDVPRAEPKSPEGHFDLAMLPGSSHPEVLHAEGVLEMVKGWLTEQGVLRPAANGVGHLPTALLGELEASLSSPALLNQFTMLNAGGVVRWWPIPSALGATRYLWVRVTAETTGVMSQLDRPEMALMLRGKAFTERPSGTSRSTELEVSADLRGRAGTSGHGGVEASAGYRLGRESSIEQNDDHVQIYWGQTKSASTEFQLRQRFRVEMRMTWQAPEVLSAPVRGVREVAFAAAGLAGHRREAEIWWQSHDPTATRRSGTVEGDVRVLVPDQLVIPGPPPPQAQVRSFGLDPVWENDMPKPANQALMDLVFEHGHPWALPAAAGVNRWAALLTASSLSRPSLATPEFWRPDSTTLAGMQYEVFTHEVLLRLNLPSLLRSHYVVPVGGENVNVGLHVLRVEPMVEHDVVMLSRHYNQAREVEENLRGGIRGWFASLGPEASGDLGNGADLQERLPGGFETEKSFERAAESQEIMERNVASTRPFRYYRADVEFTFYSRRHGWLRVTFPRGLYLMLPVSLSDHPTLRQSREIDLRAFLTGTPSRDKN